MNGAAGNLPPHYAEAATRAAVASHNSRCTGDPEGRRRKTVALTERGPTTLTAAEQAGAQVLRRCFDTLEPRQLATHGDPLTHLGAALTENEAR
ncbi:hypothetical protein ACIRF8_35085 [Streptomyces sp. NPDC102406]|uniref:hypothetical protein n=1 Tax=Streptomyces sp. NPDC102406 TaxID=3366171 RepID=UPI0037FDCCD9